MSNSRSIAWCIWIIASIFYAYQYVLRVMPSIMLPEIMQQYNIDAAIFGQFSGVYYIGYALMHLPIGIMLDRYGPKKVMSICIILTVIGLLPLIFSNNWALAIFGRLLIGIGSSAAILGTFKIIRMSFSEQRFTRMLSLSVTIGLIGAIYGGGPVSLISESLGYKAVVQIFAWIGLLLAGVTYLMIPKTEYNSSESIISNIKMVLTNGRVMLLCVSAGLMVGPLEGFADIWGSEFFKKVYGFENVTANYLPSMIFVGMCFGAPLLSFIAEKTQDYLMSIIGAGILMFLIFATLILSQLSITIITISFIIIGISCAYQILAIYKASTYVPEHITGLTTAVANMIIMSFGYAFHSVIGLVIKVYTQANLAHSYKLGISVIPTALALGIVGFIILAYKEKSSVKSKVNLDYQK